MSNSELRAAIESWAAERDTLLSTEEDLQERREQLGWLISRLDKEGSTHEEPQTQEDPGAHSRRCNVLFDPYVARRLLTSLQSLSSAQKLQVFQLLEQVILCAEDSWNRVLYYDGTDIASYVTDAYVGMAKFSIYIPELKSNGDPWSYTDAVVIRNVWQNKYLSCNSNGDLSFVANYGDAEAWTISIKDYA